MGRSLQSVSIVATETPMKNAHATSNAAGTIPERKYFLIWIGLWIAALLALLPR